MRSLALALLALTLAGCASPTAPASLPQQPTQTQTTWLPAATPTSAEGTFQIESPRTEPTVPADQVYPAVDATTMEHKLLMGYQGWFSCPGDGSTYDGYLHWFHDNVPDAAHFKVDMWPDMSEFTPSELCPTSMQFADGSPAYVYSAYNPRTVMRHFEWMRDYGIDGVFLQRFGSELSHPALFKLRNGVTENVRAAAEANGRVFAIMYDISGMDSASFVEKLESDWKYLVDVMKVTDSPSYLHHQGKPVLAIWGLGFTSRPGSPAQAMQLVDFFERNPDPRYRVTLMGGVPAYWRSLDRDAKGEAGWADYYRALNILSPWTVGRYKDTLQADEYKQTMMEDMAALSDSGVEYMPVVYPGTSFHNSGGATFNLVPRRGGTFYWRQVYNAVSIGAPMIYNAMFDEVDEATAMFKMAATSADLPAGVELIPLDKEGYSLPSDWYLQLAGAAQRMLRGEIPLTTEIPLDMSQLLPTP